MDGEAPRRPGVRAYLAGTGGTSSPSMSARAGNRSHGRWKGLRHDRLSTPTNLFESKLADIRLGAAGSLSSSDSEARALFAGDRRDAFQTRTTTTSTTSSAESRSRALALALGRLGREAVMLAMLAAPNLLCADSTPTVAAEPAPAEDATESGFLDAAPSTRIRPGVLHLSMSEMFLDLSVVAERQRVRSAGGSAFDSVQRNRDVRVEEAWSLRLGGDLVDPRFVQWDASLRLGLVQKDSRERTTYLDRSDYDSGVLLDYDVSLDFLQGKPFSANVYARHARDRVPRRFLSSLIEERREAGVSAFANLGAWTTEVGVDWSDVDRTGNRDRQDDEQLATTRVFVDNRWEISDRHDLRIAYDHERVENRYQGSEFEFNTTRDQLRLEHGLAFGPAARNRFDTYLRWNNEDGDIPRDEFEFVPRLTLRHTDRFQTAYRYSYDRIEQNAIEQDRHKADLEAIFKPSERWRVSADVFALREMVEHDAETHEFGGIVQGWHRRPSPWGHLTIDASVSGDQSRTLGSAESRFIRGESHVLDSARPTFLRQADILHATVRAFGLDRSRAFVEGRDYVVVRVGRLTAAYRLLTGRIVDGEAVLFDYRYRVPVGSSIETYRSDVRLDHEFTFGVTPYYAFEDRRQNAEGSRGRPAFADDSERHRVGVRYQRGGGSVNAEFERFDDSVEPYRAYRLDGQTTLARSSVHTMDAMFNVSHYDFLSHDSARRVEWVDLSLMNTLEFDAYWSATLKSAYRWEFNSRDGETDGVDLECGVQYRRGRLEVELTAEYNLLKIREDRDEGFGVWVHVRRDLSHLLADVTRTEDAWTRR